MAIGSDNFLLLLAPPSAAWRNVVKLGFPSPSLRWLILRWSFPLQLRKFALRQALPLWFPPPVLLASLLAPPALEPLLRSELKPAFPQQEASSLLAKLHSFLLWRSKA